MPPWEEDGGIYGIMSRMVRDIPPTFIWSLRKDQVDFRYLRKSQIVNHHAKTGTFTTKQGLCANLRNLPWYDNEESDSFYPRAYLITCDDDRQAFVDDFRITACMSIVKLVIKQYDDLAAKEKEEREREAHEKEAELKQQAAVAEPKGRAKFHTKANHTKPAGK